MIKNYLLTGIAAMFAFQSFAQEITFPEMIQVEGGTFWMGNDYAKASSGISDESPEHKVTVNSFKMSKTEVTFELFDQFCDFTGWEKPSDGKNGRGKMPASNVSWKAAIFFCNWLSRSQGLDPYYNVQRDSTDIRVTSLNETANGYRLPTEAEWEYAARGGAKGKTYIYSGSNDYKEVAWCKVNSQLSPHEVGLKKPNELGIYDMTGNVWEWCWDLYDKAYYKNSPESNPMGSEKGTDRVYRGGNWTSNLDDLRLTSRQHNADNQASGGVGIRLVQNAN
ncbi:MAG: formylglycine-generating enzyme family protein [Bacteroidales bacterium]|nr:formylglycine-generating enzyme family protein [Bacteroidales bacterium]